MANTNNESDPMLNEIRKELITIMEEVGGDSNEINDKTSKPIEENKTVIDKVDAINIKSPATLNLSGSHNIDEDVQKMRLHLNESYELFQNIGDRFESLNFKSLKNRIKNLNLSENNSNISLKKSVENLKIDFDSNYVNNSLNDLTKDVKLKFNNHVGEFGDIPEVCEFFRTCTQLEKGLERLKKQRREIMDLSNRVTSTVNVANERIDQIQKTLTEENDRGAAGDRQDKI